MHELSATQSILDIVLSEARKAGADRIRRVHLKVGKWSTFDPDSLRFCFSVLTQGTPASDAELAIEMIPVQYECSTCGERYEPSPDNHSCPGCAAVAGTLIAGRELYVECIEVA